MIDFLLSLAASAADHEFRQWNLLLLQIFYSIFNKRSINQLLNANSNSNSNLAKLMKNEKLSRKKQSSRHSRFGATFSVNTKLGHTINITKLPAINNYAFDNGKKSTKQRSNPNQSLEIVPEKQLVNAKSYPLFNRIIKQFVQDCLNGYSN